MATSITQYMLNVVKLPRDHLNKPLHTLVPISKLPLLTPNNIQNPAIHRQNLPIDILIPRQKQHRHPNFLVPARPHRRHVALVFHILIRQLALLPGVAVLGRHLGREVARRDTVDADPRALELGRHELRQVHRRALGRVVRKVALRVPHQARHGGRRDDARGEALERAAGLDGGLEEGEEGDGGEVDARHVRRVRILPALNILVLPELLLQVLRILLIGLRLGSRNASIAHQQMDVILLLPQLRHHLLKILLLANITRPERNNLARARGTVALGSRLELLHVSSYDVHFCAVGGKRLSGHEADA